MSDHSTEIIVGVVGALAAIVGGLVSGALEWFRDWLNRPILELDFVSDAAHIQESTFRADEKSVTEIFVRVGIKNLGREVARDCRVYLFRLSEVSNASIRPTRFHDSMELAWPGHPKDFAPRNIPPGIHTFVDLVSVRKDVSGWRFPLRQMFASLSELPSYRGTYRFGVVVTSDNAKPARINIDVSYDQDWHSLRANASLN